MLPISFLRQIIGMYGTPMQAVMPTYLETAMQNFRENQAKWQEAAKNTASGSLLARMHETNMAMMQRCDRGLHPRRRSENGLAADGPCCRIG